MGVFLVGFYRSCILGICECYFYLAKWAIFVTDLTMYRNHASNAYMLHALGITHVVSVGECALVPPPHHVYGHGHGHSPSTPFHNLPGPNARYVPGRGPGGHGSLWFEEREGRIKVLDIKGVCDDGIDTLEPQLEPICEWIDKARMEGGQVLVHCRVGVSRSATVTVSFFSVFFWLCMLLRGCVDR
jgi:dual specificity MAP kinase phosphatase